MRPCFTHKYTVDLPVFCKPNFSFQCWIISFSLGQSHRRRHNYSLRQGSGCGCCADLVRLHFSSCTCVKQQSKNYNRKNKSFACMHELRCLISSYLSVDQNYVHWYSPTRHMLRHLMHKRNSCVHQKFELLLFGFVGLFSTLLFSKDFKPV